MQDKRTHNINGAVDKLRPIMLNYLPIMLLSSAQKVVYYAQYYAITTANMPQFLNIFIIFNN